MIVYCSKCKINWARLWSLDNGDETYEFCPYCKTDHYLQDGNDFVSYIKCQITGKITNIDTGEELIRNDNPLQVVYQKSKKIWDEPYEDFKIRLERAHDDVIAEYQKLRETMSHDQASKMIVWPKTERKFHFDEA